MSDGIYSALSGAVAQQRALDTVANNVANAGTTGFRADRLAFREMVSRERGGPNPDGLRYVAISQLRTDRRDGPLVQTGNPLDLALSGDGMFAVETDDGVRYTRAGTFLLDTEGVLRTHGGHAVLGQAPPPSPEAPRPEPAPMVVGQPAGSLQVGSDGTVRVDGQEVGRLRLVAFGPDDLEKEGLTLFRPRPNVEGAPADEVQVLQGYLEGANVRPVEGMNELIEASRAFEAFQRVIQAFRQIAERTAREVGRSR
ncbi:MAG: flagellar basal-body rod protein FlgF [Sandaracinaceae bacterium]